MNAVILCAGRGKRLIPLTDYIAKPLLPVNGKPIILHIIENLNAVGIDEFIIVIGYKGKQIRRYLQKHIGEKIGIGNIIVRYVKQRNQLGTADALKEAVPFVDDDFIVTASDFIIFENDIKDLISMHFTEKCSATIPLRRLSAGRISEASTVKLDEDNFISRIIEKPSRQEIIDNIAACPFYIFNRIVGEYILLVEKSKRGEFEIPSAIQLMIEDNLKIKGLMIRRWVDLSDIYDLLRANFEYTDEIIGNNNGDIWDNIEDS